MLSLLFTEYTVPPSTPHPISPLCISPSRSRIGAAFSSASMQNIIMEYWTSLLFHYVRSQPSFIVWRCQLSFFFIVWSTQFFHCVLLSPLCFLHWVKVSPPLFLPWVKCHPSSFSICVKASFLLFLHWVKVLPPLFLWMWNLSIT